MEKIRSIRMGTRQIISFGTILSLMVAITVFAGWRVSEIDKNLTTMVDENSVTQRYAINFRGSVHDRAIAIRDVVLDDNQGLEKDITTIRELEALYAEAAVSMDRMFANPENVRPGELELLAEIKKAEAETMPLIEKIITLRKAGEFSEAQNLLLSSARPAFINWLARINALIDAKENENQAIAADTRSISNGFVSLVYFVCAISLFIGGILPGGISSPPARCAI